MALDDQNINQLRALAQEHDIPNRSSMSKDDLIAALDAAGVSGGEGDTQVSGFQEAPHIPEIPTTPSGFAALMNNPSKPPENQSAPPPEKLNPHLF